MTLASVAALIAQFAPVPFPANRLLLGACVAVYFALSGVLQYIVTFLDKDVLYSGKLAGGGGDDAAPAAVLRTKLPRASPLYCVVLEFPRGREVGRLEHSVGRYFDAAGALSARALSRDVKALADGAARHWAAGAVGSGAGAAPSRGRGKAD